jgi:DNA-binding transcriptional MerR regulator
MSGLCTDPTELLTGRAAAHAAGVHRNTIRAWRDAGLLPAIEIAGRAHYRLSDVVTLASRARP